MYGWRARIGVLTVSSDRTTENEFKMAFPEGVAVHAARLLLPEGKLDEAGLEAMVEELDRGADKLKTADVDVMALAMTSASFREGAGYGRQLEAELTDHVGIPVRAAAPSATRALDALDIDSVAVHTPYVESINHLLESYLRGSGYDVVSMSGLGLETDAEIGARTPESTYRAVKELELEGADGVFISCTGYRTLEAIPRLESDLGLPVVSANLATIWDTLNVVDVADPATRLGRLFDRHPSPDG